MFETLIIFHTWLLIPTLVLEAMVGYPAWLHERIPHPVVWAGYAIGALDRRWNKPEYSFAKRRLLGCLAVLLVAGAGFGLGAGLEIGAVALVVGGGRGAVAAEVGSMAAAAAFGNTAIAADGGATAAAAVPASGGPTMTAPAAIDNPHALPGPVDGSVPWVNILALILLALVGSVGLAQRSLFVHVKNVLDALRSGDLAAARQRVSMIVGRDTQRLDASGVSAAALESLAESFNDGIVAPAFWFVLGGIPGLFAYKVLNTADSLIGHKEERWRAFGWAAARADDVANLVPARIAGALLVFGGWAGLLVMFKDASKHASPNAGWPEAAMAGALGVRLGGPTAYDGVVHERPVFGTGPAPGVADLARGLRIYVIACLLLWALVIAMAMVPIVMITA
jgi:adenosylcobinamide-phosphate synthase